MPDETVNVSRLDAPYPVYRLRDGRDGTPGRRLTVWPLDMGGLRLQRQLQKAYEEKNPDAIFDIGQALVRRCMPEMTDAEFDQLTNAELTAIMRMAADPSAHVLEIVKNGDAPLGTTTPSPRRRSRRPTTSAPSA